MVKFVSINFFLFLQFLLGFSKVPVFLCLTVFSLLFSNYSEIAENRSISSDTGVVTGKHVPNGSGPVLIVFTSQKDTF